MEIKTYKKMFENEKSFWWYVGRRKIIANTMSEFIKPQGKILELGSGTGGNVSFLSSFGEYTGIEKEQLAINFAQSVHPSTKFVQGNLPQILSGISRDFDTIVLLDVLEHIENDLITLKSTAQLLKDNGTILMTMPAFPSLWGNHDKIHHHYRRYTKKMLFTVCREAGYTIKYHSYFNFLLFPLVVIIRYTKKLLQLETADDKPTARSINKILTSIFGLESKLIPRFKLPFGLSHIIILKKVTEN